MSLVFNRPLSKVITAGNISRRVVYLLAKSAMSGVEPTEAVIKKLEPTRINIAEFVVKELDAYDQRA